ncbi:hypothetical protein C2G38_288698 [Gigaspora rosea]|uniref:Uncharacterized protein n=1 Tax=Gigaspora rosea TaxID=44941 RepID=A0A397UFZ9_9GLOM|nr:hypothetical protein C2G38_288698 [Gigaspora rosea]
MIKKIREKQFLWVASSQWIVIRCIKLSQINSSDPNSKLAFFSLLMLILASVTTLMKRIFLRCIIG